MRPTVPHPIVAKVARRYYDAYPRILISCEERDNSILLEREVGRRAVAAPVPLPLHCRDLAVEPLVEKDMLAVQPANHLPYRCRRIDLADLADDSLIFFPRQIGLDPHDPMTSACRSIGFTPSIGTRPEASSTVNRVAASFRITVVLGSIRRIHAEAASCHK